MRQEDILKELEININTLKFGLNERIDLLIHRLHIIRAKTNREPDKIIINSSGEIQGEGIDIDTRIARLWQVLDMRNFILKKGLYSNDKTK